MTNAPESRQRTARLIGSAVFGVAVACVTVSLSAQVIAQAFATPQTETEACRPGISQLLGELQQARQSAAAQSGERSILRTFRAGLLGFDARLPAVKQSCRTSMAETKAARLLGQLRYAEEAALRAGSQQTVSLRRRLERVLGQLSGGPSTLVPGNATARQLSSSPQDERN